MDAVKTDSKKRIVLPGAKPGEIYEIQTDKPGYYTLVRLVHPRVGCQVSEEKVFTAMESYPLNPTLNWEELREMTRES